MRIKIWGVRGGGPTPQIENLGFGGNTACIEVRGPQNECLILDAGTGIRELGRSLIKEAAGAPLEIPIFLSHFHWDHIQGLPFFQPLFKAANHIAFFAGSSTSNIRSALEGQMAAPYFPIDFSVAAASRDFCSMRHGEPVGIGGLTVCSFPMNHPQGASGFRIECGNAVFVYATDFEWGDPDLDQVLIENAQDADLLICDAQYTDEEFDRHRGWGHSTWRHATGVARAARVKKLLLFHHDPLRDDSSIQVIEGTARRHFEHSQAAREGDCFEI
jgi:phosphoribosyl 1,2-cyclic phosphodiesterase